RTRDCRSCPLKSQCCPKAPLRRIPRSIYEEARDVARALAKTEAFERSRRDRKRVEMLFAHLKRIFRLGRLGHAAPRSSSRWQQSRKPPADSQGSSPDHRRSPRRALHEERRVQWQLLRPSLARERMAGGQFKKVAPAAMTRGHGLLQQNRHIS